MVSNAVRVGAMVLFVGLVFSLPIEEDTRKDAPQGGLSQDGSVHEVVVVGASLWIRNKTPAPRTKREIRLDVETHGTSHVNRLDIAPKGEPSMGKHHDKVAPSWKNSKTASVASRKA